MDLLFRFATLKRSLKKLKFFFVIVIGLSGAAIRIVGVQPTPPATTIIAIDDQADLRIVIERSTDMPDMVTNLLSTFVHVNPSGADSLRSSPKAALMVAGRGSAAYSRRVA